MQNLFILSDTKEYYIRIDSNEQDKDNGSTYVSTHS